MAEYLRNCWYMAGWSDEIPPAGVLARALLEEPLVLFRDEDRRVRALHDRCPHRFAPLSRGKHKGNSLECGYHGLCFDGDGACIVNPHGGADQVTNIHVLTPATVRTCHYFYASTRNYALDDGVLNERIRRVRDEIFSTEDEPMIRAQQARIGDADFWDLEPLLFRIDEGPVRVRKALKRMIEAERAAGNGC